jgi:pyridoxine 5-phosphate synthase
MTRLSVNVNKIALLRNSRAIGIPDVLRLSGLALDAGAQGLTVHPRPDGRHIRRADVDPLRRLAAEKGVEFNIEGNPFHDMLDLISAVRPDQCTLVPDDPAAATSDHGWDLQREAHRLKPLIARIRSLGIRVSLFMDPNAPAMADAKAAGADRVELYTEPYARAFGTSERDTVLKDYTRAAQAAQAAGLGVNAGHDLNRENLPLFLQGVSGVEEVSIGHALIADALEFGIGHTVELYLDAIRRGGAQ